MKTVHSFDARGACTTVRPKTSHRRRRLGSVVGSAERACRGKQTQSQLITALCYGTSNGPGSVLPERGAPAFTRTRTVKGPAGPCPRLPARGPAAGLTGRRSQDRCSGRPFVDLLERWDRCRARDFQGLVTCGSGLALMATRGVVATTRSALVVKESMRFHLAAVQHTAMRQLRLPSPAQPVGWCMRAIRPSNGKHHVPTKAPLIGSRRSHGSHERDGCPCR